jgi:hypothetical protein
MPHHDPLQQGSLNPRQSHFTLLDIEATIPAALCWRAVRIMRWLSVMRRRADHAAVQLDRPLPH